MKALKIILFILLGIVGVLLILMAVAPTKINSERSVVINAPKEVVWKNIVLFSNQHKWSPWDKKDPNIKITLDGVDGTVGVVNKWVGNDSVGTGEQTMKKIVPMSSIESELHFIKPWESTAQGYFNVEDADGGVKVSWGFKGEMPRPFNIMGLFMDMDQSIGSDFESGLANLKALCEGEAAGGAKTYEIQEITTGARTLVGHKETIGMDNISSYFAEWMPKVYEGVMKAGLKMTGAPVGLYYTWDEGAMKTECMAAIPVHGEKGKVGAFETVELKGGKTLLIDYYGDYSQMKAPHDQIGTYMGKKGYKIAGPVMEEYITDPMTEKDSSKWHTKIMYFVQ
jgi:effector-binding domain-containing protein